jgi:hypothetical protein
MIRKLLGVAVILGLSLGFVVADEIKGKVTKVAGTNVTVKNKKDEQTINIAGAKVQKKGKNGVVAADASAVTEGAFVTVIYDNGKASEVTVGGGKKKKE